MKSAKQFINIVVITDDSERAAKLGRFLENNGISVCLNSIEQRRKAVAYIQQEGPRSIAPCPDLIMFDFSEPQARVLSLLQDTVFGKTAPAAPMILLTSRSSEQLLKSGAVSCGNATMFEPKTLTSFVRKIHEHRRDRFLRAVSVLNDLGPILVRLPESFSRQDDSLAMVTA